MRRNLLVQSVILLCLGLGLAMTAMAQDSVEIVNSPEVKAELEKARKLAGDDKYLKITECLQCREIGPDGNPMGPTFDGAPAEPTKVFDNVYYVGSAEVGGWLITTSDGYILLDTMWGEDPEKTILPGMKKLGLDPAKIQYVLVTHFHGDHVDGAKYFQDNFGSRVLLSEADWGMLENPTPRPARAAQAQDTSSTPRPTHLKTDPPKRDMVGTDGQKLTLGDTTITMVLTPGHSPGSLSFIVPVFDNGEPHMWALWGGTGAPRSLEDKMLYEASAKHFLEYTDKMKVDVCMSNHPFVDGSIERMAELRNRKPGEANPLVIGQDKARRYTQILGQCATVWVARDKEGLDDAGRPKTLY